jgi:sec-independent protein translocase protein TatA
MWVTPAVPATPQEANLTGTPPDFYNGCTGFSKGGRMRSIGFPELLVILGVAVLLFGGKKIPEVAKGLGEGIRNFKTSLKGEEEKVEEKKQQQA